VGWRGGKLTECPAHVVPRLAAPLNACARRFAAMAGQWRRVAAMPAEQRPRDWRRYSVPDAGSMNTALRDRAYPHVSSGRLTTIGVAVLRTTTQGNESVSDGLISMWGTKAGTWMKSPACAITANCPRSPQRTSQTPDSTKAIVCCSP